jgi:NitT/TauT family transport system substrate-binding protein
VADKGIHSPGHGYLGFIVRSDLADQVRADPKAARGLTFTQPGPGGSGVELMFLKLLTRFGLTRDEVNVEIVPYAMIPAALASAKVDVGASLEPWSTRAIGEGIAQPWVWVDELYPNMIGAVLLYSPQMVGEKPDTARRYMVAYVAGIRDYLRAFDEKDPALRREVVQILTTKTSVKDPALYDRMRLAGLDPDGRVNRASLEHDFNAYVELGYIEKPDAINLDDLLDNSFVEHARRVLGPYRR